jgi:hypothetical protein
VGKYWHKMWRNTDKMWGNTGIKCGEILAQNAEKYWHKMRRNTGIKCGEILA